MLEKQDNRIITEMNLYNAFWGFTDKLYDKYFPNSQKDLEYECIGNIIADDYWLRSSIDSSHKLNLSIENCLKKQAKQLRRSTQ